jgi:hypothetical protein
MSKEKEVVSVDISSIDNGFILTINRYNGDTEDRNIDVREFCPTMADATQRTIEILEDN